MIRRLEVGIPGVKRLKLEIHLLSWSVRDEAVVDIPLGSGLMRELRCSDLRYGAIYHRHLRAIKSVHSDPTELWAGFFEI